MSDKPHVSCNLTNCNGLCGICSPKEPVGAVPEWTPDSKLLDEMQQAYQSQYAWIASMAMDEESFAKAQRDGLTASARLALSSLYARVASLETEIRDRAETEASLTAWNEELAQRVAELAAEATALRRERLSTNPSTDVDSNRTPEGQP